MIRLLKKLVLGVMLFIALGSFTMIQAQQFPIIAFGCPFDDSHGLERHDFFAQIDSANFNTIYSSFTTDDFDAAQLMGLHLIQPIYYPYCEGQTGV